ncbi:hypothetical protein ECEC4203_3479, partial [Escherichia coli EC4203]
MLPTYHES